MAMNDPRVEVAKNAILATMDAAPISRTASPETLARFARRQEETALKYAEIALAAADAATPSKWRPISEDNQPPLDTDVLLGWWDSFPITTWRVEAGFYGSTRGGWIHGRATHWQPFPPLPEQEGK